MAQLNGSRSMTAAAERAVTFGSCFYRWTARLLSCLGSSAAQGIGGRVRTPAPTEDLEAVLSLGGGMHATRAPSSGPSGHLPPWRGKAYGRPSVPPLRNMGDSPAFPLGPVPDRTAGAHCAPLRRKTGGIVDSAKPGAGAESHQSQISSCSGPQWGRAEPHPTTPDFARRKDFASFKG